MISAAVPNATATMRVVVFTAGEHRCAIAVDAVDCITLAAEISPVPDAPRAVLGVVNFHGAIVAVVDPQRRLGGAGVELAPDHRFAFVRTPTRMLALLATSVVGVEDIAGERIAEMTSLVPGAGRLKGLAAQGDSLVYLYDPELLLTQAEETGLAAALSRSAP